MLTDLVQLGIRSNSTVRLLQRLSPFTKLSENIYCGVSCIKIEMLKMCVTCGVLDCPAVLYACQEAFSHSCIVISCW
jgi:hypothetical protein